MRQWFIDKDLVQCSIVFVKVQGHFHSDHLTWWQGPFTVLEGYFGLKHWT